MRRAALALAALFCMAGTSRAVVDIVRWREQVAIAMQAVDDTTLTPQQHIDAATVLHRVSMDAIAKLRVLEERGGPAAQHAANYRGHLNRATR